MASKANTKIRLYVEAPLEAGSDPRLGPEQAHYLRNVMRCRVGDPILLFNGRDGEWQATLTALDRRMATAHCTARRRPQGSEPDLWLLFAPVKKARLDMIVEKATELGAGRLIPVLTRHTDVERVKTERIAANAREAAEQCERLGIPEVHPPARLMDLLGDWPANRPLLFADEEGGTAALDTLSELEADGAALLVGPEGGFAPEERERLRELAAVRRVSLGPRVLRAETAAIALLTLWQAVRGDWR